MLDKEHKWLKRGVKEAIYVRREEPFTQETEEGGLGTTIQGPTTGRSRKY